MSEHNIELLSQLLPKTTSLVNPSSLFFFACSPLFVNIIIVVYELELALETTKFRSLTVLDPFPSTFVNLGAIFPLKF